MKKTTAQDRVIRYMRRELARLGPGEPMPSIRKLMNICKAGPHTVESAVRQLSDSGLVAVRPGDGLYRGEKPLCPEDTSILVFSEEPYEHRQPGFREELVHAVSGEIEARKWQYYLEVTTVFGAELELENLVKQQSFDAAVLIGAISPGLGKCLEPCLIPAVNVIPAAAEIPRHSIATAPESIIKIQVQHLLDLGHRRIGYLHPLSKGRMHRDFLLRREAFYRFVAVSGLPHRQEWVQYGGSNDADTHQAVRAMFENPKHAPTALIIYDHVAPATYQALRELNLEPGRDVSVIGTDNLPVAEHVTPGLTTVEVSRQTVANCTVNSLNALLCNNSIPLHQLIPLQLCQRHSTASPSSTHT